MTRGPRCSCGRTEPSPGVGESGTPALYPNLARILDLLAQARRWGGQLDRVVVAAHGIDLAAAEVLVRVAATAGGTATMSGLAADSGFSASGLSRIVDRLERRRLVGCQPSTRDRRQIMVRPNSVGLEVARELLDLMEASIPEITGDALRPPRRRATATGDAPGGGESPGRSVDQQQNYEDRDHVEQVQTDVPPLDHAEPSRQLPGR